jgi:BlaI family transcriptional regulator, penicillinase repressor
VPRSEGLSRREQQAMDAVHELGEATAKEVQGKLPNPPSYSAVRAVLARLVDRGHLKYRESGARYVYSPAKGKRRARQQAVKRLVNTFFDGSALQAMNALLGVSADKLSRAELDELARLVADAARRQK